MSSDRLVTQRQILLLFFKSFYVCVCVWGGGGPVTSFTFRNSRGVQHMLSRGGGGGGRQTFYQGSGVQLLSNRTCDLYWTPCPYYRSAKLSRIFNRLQRFSLWLFIFVFHHVPTYRGMFYSAASLFYRCVSMIGFCAWIKGYCRFFSCKPI